jgi:hypothetical protein
VLSEPSRPRSRRTSGAAAHLRRNRVLLFIRSFVLPLLPSEAIELFTPMGERRWVPDWEPTFPAGPSDDDTDPGTVSSRRLTVTRPYGSSPSDRPPRRVPARAASQRGCRHRRPHRPVCTRAAGDRAVRRGLRVLSRRLATIDRGRARRVTASAAKGLGGRERLSPVAASRHPRFQPAGGQIWALASKTRHRRRVNL